MSVHSLASMDDDSYRGYEIKDGEVTEFYDHRDEPGSTGSKPLLSQAPSSVGNARTVVSQPRTEKVRVTKAGCCDSCIGCMETLGRLPYASAFCLLFIWIGTGLFCGCGIALMDETMSLYKRFGPVDGNPFSDPRPEYIYIGETMNSHYELRNKEDLGNRVPQVFESIKYSFFAIIPFMFLYSIILVCDGHKSTYELRKTKAGCKSSSVGICCSVFLIVCSYFLALAWIFFLCFTTLAVYYYRITMLRCYDLDDRNYKAGTQRNICLDLVQFGLIMFRDTTDPDRGKICGPGDSSRSTVGDLRGYCDNYHTAYRFSLLSFAGCFILILAMLNSIMILSANYNNLKQKFLQPRKVRQIAKSDFNGSTIAPSPANTRHTNHSGFSSAPPARPIVVGTSGGDIRPRRSSRDIELDYIDDDNTYRDDRSQYPPSDYTRQLDKNSHVGVDYYYRRY